MTGIVSMERFNGVVLALRLTRDWRARLVLRDLALDLAAGLGVPESDALVATMRGPRMVRLRVHGSYAVGSYVVGLGERCTAVLLVNEDVAQRWRDGTLSIYEMRAAEKAQDFHVEGHPRHCSLCRARNERLAL